MPLRLDIKVGGGTTKDGSTAERARGVRAAPCKAWWVLIGTTYPLAQAAGPV